jgi:hypothetical protein
VSDKMSFSLQSVFFGLFFRGVFIEIYKTVQDLSGEFDTLERQSRIGNRRMNSLWRLLLAKC